MINDYGEFCLTPTSSCGWVYFVQPVDGGPIKIGRTDLDPACRLIGLQTGSPVRLRVIGQIRGGRRQEDEIHQHFAHLRLHGEWFEADPELADWIHEACNDPNVVAGDGRGKWRGRQQGWPASAGDWLALRQQAA